MLAALSSPFVVGCGPGVDSRAVEKVPWGLGSF